MEEALQINCHRELARRVGGSIGHDQVRNGFAIRVLSGSSCSFRIWQLFVCTLRDEERIRAGIVDAIRDNAGGLPGIASEKSASQRSVLSSRSRHRPSHVESGLAGKPTTRCVEVHPPFRFGETPRRQKDTCRGLKGMIW